MIFVHISNNSRAWMVLFRQWFLLVDWDTTAVGDLSIGIYPVVLFKRHLKTHLFKAAFSDYL